MKNQDQWRPSKYVYRKGKLMASRDRQAVGVGSRLITDLIARFYDKNLRQYAKGKLLDLGCGKVPLFMAYQDYVAENICVDWEDTLHKNPYLDIECDITQVLPFANAEFDTIILSDVLEHIPEPEHLWTEISRVLSTQGTLLMNVPFFYCLHERPHDYYRFTEFALRRFVENSGLRLIQLEPLGGTPEIVADIFAKHLQFIPWIGTSLAMAIQYLTQLFVTTTVGKKISNKTSQAFPLGYCLIAEKAK